MFELLKGVRRKGLAFSEGHGDWIWTCFGFGALAAAVPYRRSLSKLSRSSFFDPHLRRNAAGTTPGEAMLQMIQDLPQMYRSGDKPMPSRIRLPYFRRTSLRFLGRANESSAFAAVIF